MTDRDQARQDRGALPSKEDIEHSHMETDALQGGSGIGSSISGAMGSAMLGLDQAIRREPPAQVVAAEHQPERSVSGDGSEFTIEIPSPPVLPGDHDPADDG